MVTRTEFRLAFISCLPAIVVSRSARVRGLSGYAMSPRRAFLSMKRSPARGRESARERAADRDGPPPRRYVANAPRRPRHVRDSWRAARPADGREFPARGMLR